jgi:hypothetical protein
MVSWKIWTSCSIKLENKLYHTALTGNIKEKQRLENIENTNKIPKVSAITLERGCGGLCCGRGVLAIMQIAQMHGAEDTPLHPSQEGNRTFPALFQRSEQLW